MSKNKIGNSLPISRTDQEREVLDLINKSRDLSSTVLECGSAFASVCHEVDGLARKVADHWKFKQDEFYSEFK
jgi:hypothetical protein